MVAWNDTKKGGNMSFSIEIKDLTTDIKDV